MAICNTIWIGRSDRHLFVNTASREAFPLTVFEAGGQGCAIPSDAEPDTTANRFGYWSRDDDSTNGLQWLLVENRWNAKGQTAHQPSGTTCGETDAIEAHFNLYERLLAQ